MNHMRRLSMLIAIIASAACQPAVEKQTQNEADIAVLTAEEFEKLASAIDLWPGFEPLKIPLAIYDGRRTYLFRHPSPPDGFVVENDAAEAMLVSDGRLEQITANSYAEIGGVLTATLIIHPDHSLKQTAAIAIHEAFHVYQRTHYPNWAGNEAVLFTYPIEDSSLLSLRRAETEALRRAFDPSLNSHCWAGRALDYRQQRFSAMGEEFSAYERGTELNEGLANYVQSRAEGKTSPEISETGFPTEGVRERAYVTGTAYALLLDQFEPTWRILFAADQNSILDVTLAALLQSSQKNQLECDFEPSFTSQLQRTAKADVEAVVEKRHRLRKDFDNSQGYRIVIDASDAQPMSLKGFDPSNVTRLEGALLHARYLKLGNDYGEMLALDSNESDITVLTEAAGEHPLFGGVKRVTVVTPEKPAIKSNENTIVIEAGGFSASFYDARVQTEENETTLLIRLMR